MHRLSGHRGHEQSYVTFASVVMNRSGAMARRWRNLLQNLPRYEAQCALQQFVVDVPENIGKLLSISEDKTLSAAIKKSENTELVHRLVNDRDDYASRGRGHG